MEKSNKYRDYIVTNYPESRYAEIILNPKGGSQGINDEDSPESVYKSAFICYEEEEYDYALRTVNEALNSIKGSEIEAKFELLKAYLLLRTEGRDAFLDKLNMVIINYPNTEESDHAETALDKFNQLSGEKKEEN